MDLLGIYDTSPSFMVYMMLSKIKVPIKVTKYQVYLAVFSRLKVRLYYMTQHLLNILFLVYFLCLGVLPACACTPGMCLVPAEVSKRHKIFSETGVINSCESPWRCWESWKVSWPGFFWWANSALTAELTSQVLDLLET